ncbi:sugar 3,4-ketoisomerase [Aeromonas caviae]|uniref:sugar 3,4-ketoisomerase n=1 Tax=Aeromonas caviae TaxID=648 RepID=UPI0019200007|nr:FdtA/QdtA family cupin domain-containing protein [Aeromonas caviae]MBL0558435.1 FdtA/QdtA family cupin domain-containing protein [Aeromonas caviae]MDY7800678.1 FdtA/QdtA family cupin domain-containing protein [Aeromonas caviae]
MNNYLNWECIPLDYIQDQRGSIAIAEKGRHFDFDVRRIFFLSGIDSVQERGHHAHVELRQLIFATSGSFFIDLDDGSEHVTFKIEAGGFGLLVNGLVWRTMRGFSADAVMMVLCDRIYAEDQVIREYQEFLRVLSNEK